MDILKDIANAAGDLVKIGGLLAAGFALYKWHWEQRWKKTQFLIDFMNKFDSNPDVIVAKKAIDWVTKIDIPEKYGKDLEPFISSTNQLNEALRQHSQNPHFSVQEFYIRDVFDVFFDNILKLERYIQRGVVDKDDLRPFLLYWLKQISGNGSNRDASFGRAVKMYIEAYEFSELKGLLERYDLKFPV
jgi:hypothetical protein